jgi:spermidine synthase
MTSGKNLASPTLLVSVFVIATSGIIYQLVCGTLASYVLGDSVAQFSLVIGLYLFAMGIGSYLSKFIEHDLLDRFVQIELGLALAGGLSGPLLFRVYAAYGAFRVALYLNVVLIGTLVGLEIPLLLRLLKFSLDLKDLVARVLSLDYVGALFASILFPTLLLPRLGVHQTSLFFGALNALVALAATFLFPIPRPVLLRLRFSGVFVLVALGAVSLSTNRLVRSSESLYFGAPIVFVTQSPYQRVVVTESPKSTKLFLNGNLQFSSDDEYRYHEALVHPAMARFPGEPRRILVLGGGDGLAVRELLKYDSVEHVDLVDLDAAITDFFRDHPLGRRLNQGALADRRVAIHNADAFLWLEETQEPAYDVVIVDFPDPSNYGVGKLYTDAFYLRLRERLSVHGVGVVQATSPGFARKTFWAIVTTIESVGFQTRPYHVYVPSFGDWGFVLVGEPQMAAPSSLRVDPSQVRYLDDVVLKQIFEFPRDQARVPGDVNRLNDQRLVPLYTSEWGEWTR